MTSEPIYKVFVSSTFRDLREERSEVQKALLKLNCLPVGMELFPAADDETWEFIKQQIDDSDYYVVLVAGRYGSLAADGVSFTEKEYDYAREREIPSIGFVHENRAKIPSGETDSDPELIKKLDAFIAKIQKRPTRPFTNPHQLALEVMGSFIDLKRNRPRTGFVRTDQVVGFKTYAELLEKNAGVERKIRGQVGGALWSGMLSLLLAMLAVVAVFTHIPIVSEYAFWFAVAAYMILLLAPLQIGLSVAIDDFGKVRSNRGAATLTPPEPSTGS
jgi:hypothetical protein